MGARGVWLLLLVLRLLLRLQLLMWLLLRVLLWLRLWPSLEGVTLSGTRKTAGACGV